MKPEVWISIVTAVISLVGMFVAPRIAVQLALKQFRSQKWWERQADTYETLLEALSVLQWNTGQSFNREIGEIHFPAAIFRDGKETPLFALERIAAAGTYIISERAAKALGDAIFGYANALRENDPATSLDNQCGVINDCLKIIREEAKEALKG